MSVSPDEPVCPCNVSAMRCVKTGALVVCGGGSVRRVFRADVFECEACGGKVVLLAKQGYDLTEEQVAIERARLGKWCFDAS